MRIAGVMVRGVLITYALLSVYGSASYGGEYSFSGSVTDADKDLMKVSDGTDELVFSGVPIMPVKPKVGDRVKVKYVLDVRELTILKSERDNDGGKVRREDGEKRESPRGIIDDRAFYEA